MPIASDLLASRRTASIAYGEHKTMRREPALGAAGHNHRNPAWYVVGVNPEQRRQRRRKGEHCERAGKVVDAAIALGFGKDRNNLAGPQLAVSDELDEPAEIGGMAHW